MGDVIQAFREVTCSVCGAKARAAISNPSKARGMVDAAPGVSPAKAAAAVLDLLANLPAAHHGPCGKPCCNADHGDDFKPTSAREVCMGSNGCRACARLKEVPRG